jgi:Immunoglobulin domain/Immunoglobulin I-set domain
MRISVQAVAQAMVTERPRKTGSVWKGWTSLAVLALASLLFLNGCTGSVANVNGAPAPVPPTITTQPTNQTVVAGQAATFMVAASGTAPMSYQWQKNGANIAGATSSSYTTPATATADSGSTFDAVVSNSAGSVASSAATLTVNAAAVAPSITTQPSNETVAAGQAATFTVVASGTAPLSYQWQKNGANIAGATSSSYTTPATVTADSGSTFDVVVSNSAGSATSNTAMLTVNAAAVAPTITTQPANQTVTAGQTATFRVVATGTAPLSYQWQKNGANITGANSASYTTPATATADSGSTFDVVVSNSAGSATSNTATLTVNASATVPTITAQPTGQTVSAGQSATFSVVATGTAPLSYQWAKNGAAISGATSSSYTTPGTTASDNGSQFTVVVSNSSGSVTSSPATLTVNSGGLASDCTIFASSSGNDANSGTSATAPKTFSGAAAATQPGSVVCLLAGTYNLSSSFSPPTNGTPSAWIVYKSYGNGAVNFVWTGAANASPMFQLGAVGTAFPTGPSYLEFRGLNLDGGGNAGDAFFCRGGHHLHFIGNSMSNTGGSGVGSRDCDYLTADHNVVNHNGYMPASTSVPQWYGWTSGISFNSDQWFDNYAGFHNVIANNIVVGEYDSSTNHTDGNGIILDLSNGSYSASTANTPPALIINNVVYGNGGRCIEAFVVTNFWIVNNTCYKNNLDATLGNAASLTTNNSQVGYFINNIAVAWDSGNPTYSQEGTNANISYNADLDYGSPPSFTPAVPFVQVDPLFVNPPTLAGGQYATALAPSLLGTGLTLLPTSPAIGAGIDPTTLSNLPAAIVSDLRTYCYTDINGKARPQGGSFDLGAYQH